MHFLVSLALIIGLSYLLGRSILSPEGAGNDSPLHISYAVWLDPYFPAIPHWYPHQGAGLSLLHGYTILPHYLVVAVHRLSGLSIFQTYHLISFLTFPLTALGIYALGWAMLRRQTVGLLAAFFYLLAPATWTWMHDWGFFPQQVAMIFLPLALVAFDRALDYQLSRWKTGRGRLWFSLLVVLVSLASLSHFLVGSAIAAGITLYVVFTALTTARGRRKAVLSGGIKNILLLGLIVGMILAAYLVPFYAYGQVANREGLNTPALHQLHRLPVPEFFGLAAINPQEVLSHIQFPLVVTVFASVGAGLALLLRFLPPSGSSKALPLALTALVGTVYALSPGLVGIVLSASSLLVNFLNFRSLVLVVMLLMPLLAGYGAWVVAYLLLHPESILVSSSGTAPEQSRSGVTFRGTLAGLGALTLACSAVLILGRVNAVIDNHLAYGPLVTGVDLADIWDLEGVEDAGPVVQQLRTERWPPPLLSDEDPLQSRSRRVAAWLPPERPLRLDISPHLGRLAMDLAGYADASQVNSYTFQANLIHAMWGYQQNVYYSRSAPVDEYGNAVSLRNVSQWFGTRFVLLDPVLDPVETYQEAGWRRTYSEDRLEIWEDPRAPEMATLTTRPVILVVGTQCSDAYMTLFRLANDGVLPYEKAILVDGGGRIDRYTAEQLQRFDALFLYGYDYNNSQRAWQALGEYVTAGGSLFIDTGWEYWVPEWEFEVAPDVLPMERLAWTDYGMTNGYSLGFPEITHDLDVSRFKPLVWEGRPWTLSGADSSDVREWGRVVLSAEGRPLIVAGEYGAGRVVWSGMNLIGHAQYLGDNPEELRLLGNLISWLIEQDQGQDSSAPMVSRTHRDRVEFSLATPPGEAAWLYWREAYYPSWHASVTDSLGSRDVPILRAGPGLMLMPVHTDDLGALLVLTWETSWPERASLVVSAAGLMVLAALVLDGLFLQGSGLTWLRIALTMRLPKPFLAHGPNQEWARRKQAEIAAHRRGRASTVERACGGHTELLSPPGVPDAIGQDDKAGTREGSLEALSEPLEALQEGPSPLADPWIERMIRRRSAQRRHAREGPDVGRRENTRYAGPGHVRGGKGA
ncbi:MAG: hypothetical protein AB1449_06345 [Chloroflexota bacterium]